MIRLPPREFIKLIDGRSRGMNGSPLSFAAIAELPLAIGAYLPTESTDVRLAVDYARKLVRDHQLRYEDLLEIPHLIESSAIIREKPRHLCFLGQEKGGYRLYNLVLKSNLARTEVWIATLHRIRIADLNRKLKRARANGNALRDFARDFEE